MGWIEWFGYLASVVVALSLTMNSIVKLRWFNLTGAAMFSGYGFLISALPVALLNAFIVLANIYHLFGIYRRPDRFHLVETRLTDPLMQFWMDHYRPDIEGYFPDVRPEGVDHPVCSVVLRNSEPVGFMIGSQTDQTFEVLMDYVFPAYRDFKTGHYLYRQSGFFSARGVRRVLAHAGSERHRAYLQRMGFRPDAQSPGRFEYSLV